jgi:hypothetical protein
MSADDRGTGENPLLEIVEKAVERGIRFDPERALKEKGIVAAVWSHRERDSDNIAGPTGLRGLEDELELLELEEDELGDPAEGHYDELLTRGVKRHNGNASESARSEKNLRLGDARG